MQLDIETVLRRRTLLDDQRLAALLAEAQVQAAKGEGHFIECGVYQGGVTGLLAAEMLRLQSGFKVYALDAWTGLPKPTLEDEKPRIQEGSFDDTSVEDVQALLHLCNLSEYCELVPGFFAETLKEVEGPFALAHIDCDYFQGVEECLRYLLPRMTTSAAVFVDDYGIPGERDFPGVYRAVSTVLDIFPEWQISSVQGQHDQSVTLRRRVR